MLWEKACKRCEGDLFAGDDEYGPYVKCAQCGGHLTADQESLLKTAAHSAAS